MVKDDSSISEAFSYVDPEFLLMFDFPLLEGTHTDALTAPASIVLTEEMAIKHLGDGPWTNRTWATVASHAVRVARTSPILALRYE